MSPVEAWLTGPVEGMPAIFLPAAHALLQAREDVQRLLPGLTTEQLWEQRGAASAGFHVLHMANALDRLFTYARGEALDEAQRAALRAEAVPHPELDARALSAHLDAAIERALRQLRATDPATALDERRVGRQGLPSTVLGCLFHGAEHTTRHVGQFITTVKLQCP